MIISLRDNDKFLNIVSMLKDGQQPEIKLSNIGEGLRSMYNNDGFKKTRSKRNQIDLFITDLREDAATTLSGESYQRHEPEYFDEVTYYNWFHRYIPQELLLSDCYLQFINLYRAGKNLQESVRAFLEVYDNQYIAK